jgi:hypothetical protein
VFISPILTVRVVEAEAEALMIPSTVLWGM